MTERTQDRIWIIAALTIAALIVLLPRVWAGTLQTRVMMNLGEVKDSIILQRRVNGTVKSTHKFSSVSGVDTAMTCNNDSITQGVLLVYKAGDSISSSTFQWNTRITEGPVSWSVPMYYPAACDSIKWYFYTNGTSSVSGTITGKARFDSTFTVFRNNAYEVRFDNWYTGESLPLTAIATLDWDSLGSATYTPPSPRTCIVYGWVRTTGGLPIRYAQVTFTLPDGVINGCDSTMVLRRTSTHLTNAQGYFCDTLVWTSCYSAKPYTMQISGARTSPITRQITVPDSTSYRLRW